VIVLKKTHRNAWHSSCLRFHGRVFVSGTSSLRAADAFLRGNFEKIRPRKTDAFKEIETAANRLAAYLEMVTFSDASLHEDMKKKLSAISAMLECNDMSRGKRRKSFRMHPLEDWIPCLMHSPWQRRHNGGLSGR
jgi:hypothetical protein